MANQHKSHISLAFATQALLALSALAVLSGCFRVTPTYLAGPDYKRAMILYEEGMLLEARDVASRIPDNDPSYESAKLLLSKIRSLSTKIAKEHMAIAEEFEKAGVYRSAIDSYKDSLQYNPKNDYAISRIATLKGVLLIQAEGRPGNLVMLTDRKSDKEEQKVDTEEKIHLRYLKGKAHLQNDDYTNAIEELSAVLVKSPSYKDARKLLEQAKAELKAEVNEHLKMGMAYFQNEQIELAIEEWDAVLELDPENKTARDYRNRAKTIYERLETIRESNGK